MPQRPARTARRPKPGATHEQVRPPRALRARPAREPAARRDDTAVLYGWHTVTAALENPARRLRKLLATENAARRLAEEKVRRRARAGDRAARRDRGAAAAGRRAPGPLCRGRSPALAARSRSLRADGVVLVLDQITDPHNVGAIFRSAAAFAATAIVTTARHSPEATGVLAKSASGALEHVPLVTVQNLARALAALKERGFLVVGLDSSGEQRSRRAAAARAAGAGARRRGQGLAATDQGDLRSRRAARSAGRDPRASTCRTPPRSRSTSRSRARSWTSRSQSIEMILASARTRRPARCDSAR